MEFRRETEQNMHCGLIREVYHHPEQHKIQAMKACWTDPNEQESGVGAKTEGDFLQILDLISVLKY